MQLGKALIGAIIGGLLGIAALIAIQHFTGLDKTWLAIVVALLTGLGVRAMVSTTGHTSYVRGALTGVLALAAYYGGTQLYSQLAQRNLLAMQVQAPPPAAVRAETEKKEAATEVAAPAEVEASAESKKELPAETETETETEAEANGVAVPLKPVAIEQPAAVAGVSHDDGQLLGPIQLRPSSPWDYMWLSIAALIAYEFGRGSAPAAPKVPVVPPPDAT